MTPERVDRLLRALAVSAGSRRAMFGGVAAAFLAMAASSDARTAKKRKPKRNRKRKRRQKSGKASSGGCANRYSEQEILGFIKKAAKKYNQSTKAMERVARCESNLDPCAVNRSGPYYGLFQFLKSTWKTTPYGNRDIYDPEAQALATAWMWKEGRKNEWACQ
jgi:hypothetical protein